MIWASDTRKNDAIDEVGQSRVVYRPEFQTITYQIISLKMPAEDL